MKINLRKWYKNVWFSISQSDYHDKRYILIHLYRKTLEIELWDTFVKGKEICFEIQYYFSDRVLFLWFYKWSKILDFYKHNETYTTRKIIKNLFR